MRSDLKLFFVVVTIFALSIIMNMNVLDTNSIHNSNSVLTGHASDEQFSSGSEHVSTSFQTAKALPGCNDGVKCKADKECSGDQNANPIVDGICTSEKLTCDCSPTCFCSSIGSETLADITKRGYNFVGALALSSGSLDVFSTITPPINTRQYYSTFESFKSSLVSDLANYGFMLYLIDDSVSSASVSSELKKAIPEAQKILDLDAKVLDENISKLNDLSKQLTINLTNVTDNLSSTNSSLNQVIVDLDNNSADPVLLAKKQSLEDDLSSLLLETQAIESQLAVLSTQISTLKSQLSELQDRSKNMFADVKQFSKMFSCDDKATCCLSLVFGPSEFNSFLTTNSIDVVVALGLTSDQVTLLTNNIGSASILSYDDVKTFKSSFTSNVAASYGGDSLIVRGDSIDVSSVRDYLNSIRPSVEKTVGKLNYFDQESILKFNVCSNVDIVAPVFAVFPTKFYVGTTDLDYKLSFESTIQDNVEVKSLVLVDNSIFKLSYDSKKGMYTLSIDKNAYPLTRDTYYTVTLRATDTSNNVADKVFTLYVGSKGVPVDPVQWKTHEANVAHTSSDLGSSFSADLGILKTLSFDSSDYKSSSIISDGSVVVINLGNILIALDASTQKTLWTYNLPSSVEDMMFSKLILMDNGMLSVLLSPYASFSSIEKDSSVDRGASVDEGASKDEGLAKLSTMKSTPSVVYDEVYTFNLKTGNYLFSEKLDFTVSSFSALSSNVLLMLSSDGTSIYTLDLLDIYLNQDSIKSSINYVSHLGSKGDGNFAFSSSSIIELRKNSLGLSSSNSLSESAASNLVSTVNGFYYSIKDGVCKVSSDLSPVWCTSITSSKGDSNLKITKAARVSIILPPPIVQEDKIYFMLDNTMYVLNSETGNITSNQTYENKSVDTSLIASNGNIFAISSITYSANVGRVISKSVDDPVDSRLVIGGSIDPIGLDDPVVPDVDVVNVSKNNVTENNETSGSKSDPSVSKEDSHPSWMVFDTSGSLEKEILLTDLSSVNNYIISNNFIYVLDSASGKLTVLSDIVSTKRGGSDKDLSLSIDKQNCDQNSETIILVRDDDGDHLSGARINLEGPEDYSGRSDSDGVYSENLRAGTYLVTVSKSGYSDKSSSFTLKTCPIFVEVGDVNKTSPKNDTVDGDDSVDSAVDGEGVDSGDGSNSDSLIETKIVSDDDLLGSNDRTLGDGSIFNTDVTERGDSSIKFKSSTATFSWFIFLVFLLAGIALYVSHKKSMLIAEVPKNRLRVPSRSSSSSSVGKLSKNVKSGSKAKTSKAKSSSKKIKLKAKK